MKLNKNKDMIIIIDMVNGFVKEGPMASKNVLNIVNDLKNFVFTNIDNGIKTIHYTDSHCQDALEFKTYPIHCLENSDESYPISELRDDRIELIKKNSTNGFLAFNPFKYQKNLYIVGCVIDICVFEFALTAKKYTEEHQLPYSINILQNMVATFDAPNHDNNVIKKQYLDILKQRGINII